MIVFDASAAVLALLNDGEARRMLREAAVACPHLTDSEVVHALRSQVLRGDLDAGATGRAIDIWASPRALTAGRARSPREDLGVA